MTYEEIAELEEITACRCTLIAAFEKEQYHRRVATEKPLLTEAHKQARLAWAYLYRNWISEMWVRVVWTDECCFDWGFGKVYVTRRPKEKYLDASCFPMFRGYSSWMIYGSISALGKGSLVVFEKEWGKITGEVYRERVISHIYHYKQWLEQYVGWHRVILTEGGVSQHTANAIKAFHTSNHDIKMTWPANFPDLNPIENVWRLLNTGYRRDFPRQTQKFVNI
jgi:hypothetical protein